MTGAGEAILSAIPPSQWLIRGAEWCAYASGIVSIFGILFMAAFYTTFNEPLGTSNDIAVAIQLFAYGLIRGATIPLRWQHVA